jgi:hypothetical protein
MDLSQVGLYASMAIGAFGVAYMIYKFAGRLRKPAAFVVPPTPIVTPTPEPEPVVAADPVVAVVPRRKPRAPKNAAKADKKG